MRKNKELNVKKEEEKCVKMNFQFFLSTKSSLHKITKILESVIYLHDVVKSVWNTDLRLLIILLETMSDWTINLLLLFFELR